MSAPEPTPSWDLVDEIVQDAAGCLAEHPHRALSRLGVAARVAARCPDMAERARRAKLRGIIGRLWDLMHELSAEGAVDVAERVMAEQRAGRRTCATCGGLAAYHCDQCEAACCAQHTTPAVVDGKAQTLCPKCVPAQVAGSRGPGASAPDGRG